MPGKYHQHTIKVAFMTPDRISFYSTAAVGGFNRAAQFSLIICTLYQLFFCSQKLSMVPKEPLHAIMCFLYPSVAGHKIPY